MTLNIPIIMLFIAIISIRTTFADNVNPIILDTTHVINKLVNGSECPPRSVEDLMFDIDSPLLFYETNCQRISECIHQINDITQSLQTAILFSECNRRQHYNGTFIFSIPITDNNADYMCNDKWDAPLSLDWPCGQIAVVISLKLTQLCDSRQSRLASCFFNLRSVFKQVQVQAIHPNLPVGLGFERRPALCQHHYEPCFKHASFFVLTEPVGYGSAEMYSRFSEQLISFQKNDNLLQPDETCRHPIPKLIIRHDKLGQFGEAYLQNYLWYFLQILSQNKDVGLVLSPSSFNPIYISANYTSNLIGIIDPTQCFQIHEVGCYGVSTVKLLLEQFGAHVLKYGQWKSIQEVLRFNPNIFINPGLADALVDYSHTSGVSEIELNNLISINKLSTKFKATSLIVPLGYLDEVKIEDSSNENISTKSWSFVKNVSVEFQILCLTHIEEQSQRYILKVSEQEYANTITLRCAEFGGTNFIFDIEVDMQTGAEMGFSESFYKKKILTLLRYALNVRGYLWLREPSLKPYVKIRFTLPPYSKLEKELKSTVFCNKMALKLNKLLMQIQSWASVHGFSVILKSALDNADNPEPTSWLTNLIPNFFYVSTDDFMKKYPIFVLRDYPKEIGKEPCVEWALPPLNVGDNFFLNSSLGVTLEFHFHEKETVTIEEWQTVFEFIFHKFQILEILFGSITEALSFLESMPMEIFALANQSQVFVDYLVSNNKDESPNALFNIFDTIQQQIKAPNLKWGVILNVINIDIFSPVNNSELLLNTENINYINSLVDFSSKTYNKIGIASSFCEGLLLEILRNESKIYFLLDKIQYLACYSLTTGFNLGKDALAKEFDGFLYIKKVLARHYPDLTLVFRIYPHNRLAETEMKKYVQFLFYLEQLGSHYNIKFFPVRAFDLGKGIWNGWWTIKNNSDLTNVSVYYDKESVYSNRETWRPVKKKQDAIRKDSKVSMLTYILISTLAFVLLIVCLVGTFVLIRYKRMKLLLSDKEVKDILYGRLGRTEEGVNIEGQFGSEQLSMRMKFDFKYEISKSDIAIDTNKILGFGQFGTVFKGSAKGAPVAIKMPNRGCSATTLKTFLAEVNVLCYVGRHPHIVEFVGAFIQEIRKGILQVATELCSNGSLESYLRRKEYVVNLNEDISGIPSDSIVFIYDMYRFCSEIASGMQHIAEKHFIHGDLAARNVLLDSNFTCKICDFGFSRKLYNYETYLQVSQVPLPWRWAAYEVLSKREFSIKSDVWSFGITMWEIFSLGNLPYANCNLSTEFIAELKQGLRPPQPEYASGEIYEKLLECWNIKSEQRPKFNEIGDFFKNFCSGQYSSVDMLT